MKVRAERRLTTNQILSSIFVSSALIEDFCRRSSTDSFTILWIAVVSHLILYNSEDLIVTIGWNAEICPVALTSIVTMLVYVKPSKPARNKETQCVVSLALMVYRKSNSKNFAPRRGKHIHFTLRVVVRIIFDPKCHGATLWLLFATP